MAGKYTLQELRDNARSEDAAAKRYAEAVKEFDRLEKAGGAGKSEAEVMQQALTNLYGDKAPEMAREFAAYADKYRVADAGEHLSAARSALDAVKIDMPGGPYGAASRTGEAQAFLQTRNDMRHPDENKQALKPQEYQDAAVDAQKEIAKSEATLKSWLEPGSKKQLTKEQRAAVKTAYNELHEMSQDLEKIKSGATLSSELTRSDVELARNARIIQSSGFAADHVQASRSMGLRVDPEMKQMADRGRDVIHMDPNAPRGPSPGGPSKGSGASKSSGPQSQGAGENGSAVSGAATGTQDAAPGKDVPKAEAGGEITGRVGGSHTEYPTAGANALKPQQVVSTKPAPKLHVVPAPARTGTEAQMPHTTSPDVKPPKLTVVPRTQGNGTNNVPPADVQTPPPPPSPATPEPPPGSGPIAGAVETDAAEAARVAGATSSLAKVGGAALPGVIGGVIEGGTAAAQGKSGTQILEATGHGVLNGAIGIEDAKTALDSHQRPMDRILGGLRAGTAATATGAGIATLTPLAPAAGPVAFGAGVANVTLGVVQDIAHWTGLANNPGTIEQTYDMLSALEKLSQKNEQEMFNERKDPLGTFKKALESGDKVKAQTALTIYENHLLYEYRNGKFTSGKDEDRYSNDDDKNGKNAAKAAMKLAQNLYDDAAKRDFHPAPAAAPEALSPMEKARQQALQAVQGAKGSIKHDEHATGYVPPPGVKQGNDTRAIH